MEIIILVLVITTMAMVGVALGLTVYGITSRQD